MQKPKLDLLASIQLEEVLGNKGVKVPKTQKNPTNADLRLFADGSIYPSKELVEEFQLEYQKKDSDLPEFGFDVFETSKWGMWPAQQHFVVITQVSKHAKKVDLFSKTGYDKDTGEPRSSVIDQGAGTFGKRLITMLEETYEVDLFKNGNSFVDLLIAKDSPVPGTKNGIYNIPKMIVKGAKAGTYSTERRENITVYPLIISEESLTGPITNKSQDSAVDEIASFGQEDEPASGGDYADENLLSPSADDNDILNEAEKILGSN
jgi:hypothetical protein